MKKVVGLLKEAGVEFKDVDDLKNSSRRSLFMEFHFSVFGFDFAACHVSIFTAMKPCCR